MNSSKNASCQQLFRELNIRTIQSQYIFSIILFVTKNKDQFLSNSQYIRSIQGKLLICTYLQQTWQYTKRVSTTQELKSTNHLPTTIKDLSVDKKKSKLVLKRCLLHNSFYSLEEYFNI